MKHIGYLQNKIKKFILGVFLFVFLVSTIYSSNFLYITSNFTTSNNEFNVEDRNLKTSALLWGWINFTNTEAHVTPYFHGEPAIIEGRLFHYYTNLSYQGYTVSLVDDGTLQPSYNDVTDQYGRFQINYTIPFSGNVYSGHNITAEVTDPGGAVEFLNYNILYYSAYSSLDVSYPDIPVLNGEFLDVNGYLRYDNGSGIPWSIINYYWDDGIGLIDSNFVPTDGSGLIQPIYVPDIGTTDLNLNLTFASPPEVGYSEVYLMNPMIFSNISCIWDLPSTIRASSDLRISGKVISRTNPSLAITNRMINIFYNGTFVDSITTDSSGDFSVVHALPQWTGQTVISIRLPNNPGKNIVTRRFVTVQQASISPGSGPQAPPFLMFFSIFLPIIGVVVGGLAFYGYRYYKKQNKLSKVANLPLEDKIINLKILKESGRLEESLSYLFIAIYMDLIGAKFGRTRKGNETIRDFAIISVKNLKLSPATIYPFIQKVEEIIYAKPFQITDKEFYRTINLFSPVYYELTGYNFELNF